MHDLCFRDHAAGQQRAGDPGAKADRQTVHQVQHTSYSCFDTFPVALSRIVEADISFKSKLK